MDGLLELDALTLAIKVRRREISAVEITEASIARIEALNSKLNAVCTLAAEAAIDAARNSMGGSPAGRRLGRSPAYRPASRT